MKRPIPLRKKLRDLLAEWQRRHAEFNSYTFGEHLKKNPLNRNRYEGIATGTRWCIEDIRALL